MPMGRMTLPHYQPMVAYANARSGAKYVRRKRRRLIRKFIRKVRRYNRGKQLSYVGPSNSPLPDFYFTKLHYQDWFNVASSGSTGVYDWVFYGNNAYDPLVGIANKGCAGFTELASIYAQSRCYASKITVITKSISDATATGDAMCMVIPDRSSTSYSMSTCIDRQASPYSKVKMINRGANGVQPTTIKNFRKTKDIYGESDIDDDVYASSTTSDTLANPWYFHVIHIRGDQNAISAYPGFQMMVKITYYIRFEKRKSLAAP